MTTFELVKILINCKNKKEVRRVLEKHRIPVNKSKYC